MIYDQGRPKMKVRCLENYGECGWEGYEEECETLNGNPICAKCGSDVEAEDEYPRIAEMMERMERMGI